MKEIILVALSMLLLSFVTSSFVHAEQIAECALTDAQKELYLIIQSSHKAVIEKKGNNYSLTLYDVQSYATAFTQRPVRKVELITLNNLIGLWNNSDPNGFSKNPPNAAINAFVKGSGSEDHINFFVQLLNPKYDFQKRTLRYDIKVMDGNTSYMPDYAVLGHVNLFIDDICLNCWWPNGR